MDPYFTQRSARLLEQLQAFLNSINMLVCVICSNEIKDARLCPKCSYMCCFGCFKKTSETCGKFCPRCSVPLQEDQLLTIFWLEEMIALLKNTQSFLRDLPSAMQRQNSGPLPDLVEHEDDLVDQLADGIISVLPDAAPVCELQSTSRFSLPVFQEMYWMVSAIRWSRVFSDLFFAGLWLTWCGCRGLLGLFTVDLENHAGCTIEFEGIALSLDVHPINPCLVSVGTGDGSCGVHLYLLHGGQLETVDLSTCNGRRLFQEDFKASPSNYRFDRVWRVELSYMCTAILWWSPSELIVLTDDRLIRLQMPQPTDKPTVELLLEPEDKKDYFFCMAIQRRPQLTTLHCDTQPASTGDEQFCKLAIGTEKGEIRVISMLPSLRTEWRLVRAHNNSVSAIEWNPVVPEILASCFNDGCIKFWRTGCEQPLLNVQVDGVCSMIGLRWAPFSSTMFAVVRFSNYALLFDLAVDQENPVAAIERDDGYVSYFTFHPFRPSLLLGYETGRGFEQMDLRPTPILKRQVGFRVWSMLESVALPTETEKLKAILKL